MNQGNHQVSEGSGPGSESQSGGGEVRLSAQRPSLLDPRPERPLGAHFSRAPRPRHSCAVGPLAAAQPDRLRSGAPSPAAQARSPGTCGRAVPAAAQLPAPAEPIARARLPRQVSISPRGREGQAGRVRSPAPTGRARRPSDWHLRGWTPPPRARFPGGPWRFRTRQAAAPRSTAQKMDAGWALPARPAPGAGHWPRPVREEVGPTLCTAGRCCRGLAAP